jgi:predicted O-linked N-acetylglucosamine transferase (SPINDLY family)
MTSRRDQPEGPPEQCAAKVRLANDLASAGDIDGAIQNFREALALNPGNAFLHDDLVYLLHFHPQATNQDLFREAAIWEWQHARALSESIPPHQNNRDPNRKLKIGYVSPEFYRQAESFFIVPLLQSHDHSRFEIHCYSSVQQPDDRTGEIRKLADTWYEVGHLNDDELARKIREDQIDILIDLTMHMRLSRLLTFARKPAPVQVTWLAYPGGTGLRTMDWRLTDAYLDPPHEPGWYCERSIRLPDSWVCYNPLSQAALATPRTSGPITFGSLNHPRKINDLNLILWADLMRRVEGSRILLGIEADSHCRRARSIFENEGIAADRVEFRGKMPRWEYLRAYDQIDIALDTLPYNGITTTCDALWMGTPVVSLIGKTTAGRAGLGILSNAGLPELAAKDSERFIEIAVKLAADREKLIDWKRNLRRRLESSPLMDAGKFARNVEIAYRWMWQRWCNPPEPGCVDPIPPVAIEHQNAGRLSEAEPIYRQMLAQNPDHPEALQRLGMIAIDVKKPDKALELIGRAIAVRPDLIEPYYYLGNALKQMGRLDEAMVAFQQAIALRPDLPEPHINLGGILLDTGRTNEAVESFREAVRISPDYPGAYSNLLLALNYLPELDVHNLLSEHQAWARRSTDPLTQNAPPHKNDPSPHRPLRIGYVSPDFWRHSVSYFLLPLLENRDRQNFEVFCYASMRNADDMTQRIRSACDVWRDIASLGDDASAQLIRSDRIDILVDLSGHTAGNRLAVFACKPAPIQATYLGYPNTTGMRAIDYRLTDSTADPPGMTESLSVEKIWRLPRCAWCFQPPEFAPAVEPRDPGPITFGCFGAFAKINPQMLENWAKILHQVPESRLMIKSPGIGESSANNWLISQFAKYGIAAQRIDLMKRVSEPQEHLRRYHDIDLELDTYPYNGTTTTCEALWMGIPVVTLAGATHVSRVGASLLGHVGLQNMIADSSDVYISIAVALANDPDRLFGLRRTLRQKMAASPLMDGGQFARDVESAYRRMWRNWCQS